MTFDQGPDDIAEDRLRAAVESIGDHARSVNLDRADRLDQALADVSAGLREERSRREAAEVAHQLVGSAGTFGFSGASRLAGEIQRFFVEGDPDDADQLAMARDQVRRLREELATGPDYQPDEDDPTS